MASAPPNGIFLRNDPTDILSGTRVEPVGRWLVDPERSSIGFVARHLLVSKVHGRFGRVGGVIVVAADPAGSSVQATVEVASLDTGDVARDEHLLSPDFFDAERWPVISLSGAGVRHERSGKILDGYLTIRDITVPVALAVTAKGIEPESPGGPASARFTARASVNRKEFGLRWNSTIETGGVVVGDMVDLQLTAVAVAHPDQF